MTSKNCFIEEDSEADLATRMRKRQVDWPSLQLTGCSNDCEHGALVITRSGLTLPLLGANFIWNLVRTNPEDRMSITQARAHAWIQDIKNEPPPGWVGSQSQPSQRLNVVASQAVLAMVEEMGELKDENFDENGSYRGRTAPPPSSEELRAAKGRFNNGQEQERWDLRAGQSAFSNESEIINVPGAYGGASSSRAQTPATPSANHGALLSQSLADLDLEGKLDGVTVNGGATSPSENGVDSGGSFVNTSVGTPPNRKEVNAMEVDGQSWEVLPTPAAKTPARPVKGVRGAATTGRKAGGSTRASARRLVTPTPGNVHGVAPAPTTTKRKAMNTDFDSELSSAPASDKDTQAVGPRIKVAKTSSRDSAGTARAGGRTRKSTGGANVTPQSAPPRTTRQSKTTVPQGKRRPANTIRAPSGSSDEEDEPAPVPGPSTRRTAPPPTTRPTRVLPVKYNRR